MLSERDGLRKLKKQGPLPVRINEFFFVIFGVRKGDSDAEPDAAEISQDFAFRKKVFSFMRDVS